MELFKISKDDYQYIDTLCRLIQERTRGCRQKEKNYGENMIKNVKMMRKRIDIDDVPFNFLVIRIKHENAGRYAGRYADYYKTVDCFRANRKGIRETDHFLLFNNIRVKKENVLTMVF